MSSPRLIQMLTRVQEFAHARRVACFLVGGLVRDQLLDRPPAYFNVDVAVSRDALAFSRALATHVGGSFVPLDDAVGSARVVLGETAERFELDISDFRGPTLEADLRLRDFTVNAIAIALADWLRDPRHPGPLIDPCDGRAAIARKQLIACYPGTFDEDPVRILRGFRFAAQLEFTLDASLEPLMAKAAPRLVQVSGERLRDELAGGCAPHPAGRGGDP